MATPSRTEFLARFPEFGEQSPSVVDEALREAGRYAPTSTWGSVHTEAVSYMAAHILATRTMQLGLQIEAKSGTPTGVGFKSSLYGQEFERLLNCLPLSGFAL